MKFFEVNKIAGAIFTALLILMVGIEASHMIFESDKPEKPGYIIDVPKEGVKSVVKSGFESSLPLIAKANIKKGQRIFKICASCHDGSKGGVNKIGPHLWNVVARKIANVTDFTYSKTLLNLGKNGKTWTFDNLDRFIRKPSSWAKGTKMSFAGLSKAKDRANLIAYLRTLADNPISLPSTTNEKETAPVDTSNKDKDINQKKS